MLKHYWPEMGDKEPTTITAKQHGHLTLVKSAPIEIKAQLSYGGGWYVKTTKDLKGRGIRKDSENTYHMTNLAFEKLCSQYDVKTECLLD